MPLYDYKCPEHGYFEAKNSMADHARAECPTCGEESKQVILRAPQPLIEAMADAGCPGAFHTSGDRMEKRHREDGQYHTATHAQQREMDAYNQEFIENTSVTPASE